MTPTQPTRKGARWLWAYAGFGKRSHAFLGEGWGAERESACGMVLLVHEPFDGDSKIDRCRTCTHVVGRVDAILASEELTS